MLNVILLIVGYFMGMRRNYIMFMYKLGGERLERVDILL